MDYCSKQTSVELSAPLVSQVSSTPRQVIEMSNNTKKTNIWHISKVTHALWTSGQDNTASCCRVGVWSVTPEGHIVLQRRRKWERGHGSRVIQHLQAHVPSNDQSAQVLQGARFTCKHVQRYVSSCLQRSRSAVSFKCEAMFYSVCQKSPPTRAWSSGSVSVWDRC